jgi:hypothetical protein
MEDKNNITNLLLQKFVTEEIMTKSEFPSTIDRIMEKHEARFDAKFNSMEARFDAKFDSMEARFDRQFLKIDHRYNWIIGVVIAASISLAGLMIKLH